MRVDKKRYVNEIIGNYISLFIRGDPPDEFTKPVLTTPGFCPTNGEHLKHHSYWLNRNLLHEKRLSHHNDLCYFCTQKYITHWQICDAFSPNIIYFLADSYRD